ncbi:hypothetical protein Tco_0635542 [Tanacetum coccineum]
MWESNSYKAHEDHKKLYEALEQSMARDHTDQLLTDLAEARKKKKKRHDSPKTPPGSPPHLPPPPPPPAAASAEYTAWTTTDTRLKPSVSSIPEDLHMDDDTAPDEQVHSSGDEDIGHDHIPTVNLKQNWWKPLTKDRPTTPEPAWSIPSFDFPVPMNNWASALASTYAPLLENSLLAQTGDMAIFMDWFSKSKGSLNLNNKTWKARYNVSKPLPLGSPPGQVTIQSDFFFNKDLEYLRYGHKSGKLALSISKMKATYYPDVGQRFYIDRHISEGDRRAVRTHMRILSVFRIEVLSLYGYDYMKKIVLHRADLKEYTIAERDFKYLYPSDFEDMYLLNLQGHLNHLPPEDKKILTTAVNLWTRNLVIRQRIDEALDYRVKEFKVNRINPGLNTWFWTRKDVDRSKEFMFAIQKRIKTRRIFQNLESFVGGRIREGDYRLLKRTE